MPNSINDPLTKETYEITFDESYREEEKPRISKQSILHTSAVNNYQEKALKQVHFELQELLKIVEEVANITEIEPTNSHTTQREYNWHPDIFKNEECYNFFNALRDDIVTEKNVLADYSFIFHFLKKDNFIHNMKHQLFIDFLNANFNDCLEGKIQFTYSATESKKRQYTRLKGLFKLP